MTELISFREVLSGEKVFYNQPDYEAATRRDFASAKTLPATYTWNTQSKIVRIVKQILAILIFPIAIYQFLHALAGKIIIPASSPSLLGLPQNYLNRCRSQIPADKEWKYKRLTIEVDGYKIDATLMGKASTLGNGRWVLASNGNAQFYENTLASKQHDVKQILTDIQGNGIFFNYPGVGASSGMPNRQAMAKAYRAILSFLEDQEKGIGAKEIIGYGHSIGAGVQGDALKTHSLKPDVNYVFVKSRTFSDLSTTASALTNRVLGLLVRILGWNIDSVASSRKLKAQEIILQTANVNNYQILDNPSKILHDQVIPGNCTLTKALLEDPDCPKENKRFIGIPDHHNAPLSELPFLADQIKRGLCVNRQAYAG